MALQKTTEKKLTEIYNFLKAQGSDHVARLVTEILRAECMVKRGTKFSMYDFVDKSAAYKPMSGVYHEGGYQIATDGHKLMMLKADYAPELEGKLIDKNGEEIEARPVNYKAVLPKSIEGYDSFQIDPEVFYSWIDERRAAYKLEHDGKDVKWDSGWFVRVNKCLFRADDFNMIIKAGKALGSLILHTAEKESPGVIKTESGTYLAMPWKETDNSDVLTLAPEKK